MGKFLLFFQLDMLDFLPKVGMNAYFFEHFEPLIFFRRWYNHKSNPYLDAESVSTEEILAMLTALALVLGYVEYMIPVAPAIPGIKLGLGNTVLLYAVYMGSPLEATLLMLAKVFLSSLLFGGGFSAMIYSLAGGVLSLIAMLILCRVPKVGVLAVSAAGAVCHNLGQIIAASLMLGIGAVWAYFPVLVISGLIMGPLTGLVAKLVFRALKRAGGQQDINPKAFEDHRAIDITIIGILLVLAVGAWLLMNHLGLHVSDAQEASERSGYYVEVVQNSDVLYEIPVEEYGTYTIRIPSPASDMVASGNKRTLYQFSGWKISRNNNIIDAITMYKLPILAKMFIFYKF